MLALTDLHARVLLIDHVNAAFTAHNTAILVARLGRLQRITDSHDGVPRLTLVNERGRKIRTPPALVNIYDTNILI